MIARNDPHVVMSRIGAMRRLYYEEGEFGYERTSPTSARIFVRGMATVTTPDCESTAGFYEVAIARSGGRDVEVLHGCRLDGAPTARSTAAGAFNRHPRALRGTACVAAVLCHSPWMSLGLCIAATVAVALRRPQRRRDA